MTTTATTIPAERLMNVWGGVFDTELEPVCHEVRDAFRRAELAVIEASKRGEITKNTVTTFLCNIRDTYRDFITALNEMSVGEA